MTRDRKKNFISCVERTIAQLEQENQKMRETLRLQIQNHENKACITNSQHNDEVSIDAASAMKPAAPVLYHSIENTDEKSLESADAQDINATIATYGYRLIA